MNEKIFEVLVLDPSNKTLCDNALSLLHRIRGLSVLWKAPKLFENTIKIEDGDASLSVRDPLQQSDADNSSGSLSAKSFVISLSGKYERIEPLRVPLSSFIKDQGFEHRYIIRDDASEEIACKLYPYLYQIETLLRGHVTRFMATRIGATWWESTASSEMNTKASQRKRNEPVFGKLVNNSAYLIDFEDLGELIYKHSSGFLTKDDIIRKITQMQETPAAVKALKEEIKSNYQKYFKNTFADQDFEGKWKYWEQLRNKIAHTNLFTSEDLIKGKTVADELIKIIRAADESTAGLIISPDEREAIREQIIQKTENAESDSSAPDSKWKSINQAELLSELREQESYYLKRHYGFVGLSRFVRKHLLSKGYSLGPSYSQMEHLIKAGKIEVYYVENPFDDETTTAALRSLSTPNAA